MSPPPCDDVIMNVSANLFKLCSCLRMSPSVFHLIRSKKSKKPIVWVFFNEKIQWCIAGHCVSHCICLSWPRCFLLHVNVPHFSWSFFQYFYRLTWQQNNLAQHWSCNRTPIVSGGCRIFVIHVDCWCTLCADKGFKTFFCYSWWVSLKECAL